MRPFIARWARQAGLVVVFSASSGAVAVAAPAWPSATLAAADVTDDEVSASNEKVRMAFGALAAMWTADFKELGARFVTPGLLRYRGTVRTACGVMPANNAMYCPGMNAVFFDEIFVARQSKAAARQLGTDGDMVAVGIIAHEMGHAVAMQLGAESGVPYENEARADCLAGAFTQRSARDGSLERGDLEEAFFGMAAAGDPTPQLTGVRRYDDRIMLRASLMGHGTRDQRMANFEAGFDGGAGACLEEFRR
jgi:predicted metalloprotease